MRVWCTPLLVALLTASACFRDGGLGERSSPSAPGPLLVRDREGVSYAASDAPRDASLVLAHAGKGQVAPHVGGATTVDGALLLLRGQFDVSLSVRLASARKSVAVASHTTAIEVLRMGDELRIEPREALLPGVDYTLFWLGAEARAAYLLHVSEAPALGARLVETWPRELAIAPPNLQRALLRFDGDLADTLDAHVALSTHEQEQEHDGVRPAGTALPTRIELVRCATLGMAAGQCAWVVPLSPLEAGSAHTLALDAELRTQTGALLPAHATEFTVATEPDLVAPAFVPRACASDEQTNGGLCTRTDGARLPVRGAVDESALLTLTSVAGDDVRVASALSYANAFELSLDVSAAPSSLGPPGRTAHAADDTREARAVSAVLRARDLAGNEREQPLALGLARDLAAVTIDEVLADPRGKEPAQEWVELLNSALTPSSLMGFTLSTDPDERGRVLTGAVVLAPHERALVVAPAFDPHDLADGALPAGLRLVTLDGPLSLGNGASTLYLRDGEGRRISTAKVLAPLFEGQCSARLPARGSPAEGPLALDPAGGCTPGSATFRASAGSLRRTPESAPSPASFTRP